MKRIALLPILLLAACSGGSEDQPAPAGTDGASAAASGDAAPAASESAETASAALRTSRYTTLKDCKVVDDGGGEDWSVSRCEGLGDYALQVNYFDARDSLSLIRGGKVTAELKLWLRGGGGFNSIGDTVEWRGSGDGGRFVPTALIVRNHVFRDPEQPDRSTGVLEVIDLARGCLIASLAPKPGQNEAARAIADGPEKPCLGEES